MLIEKNTSFHNCTRAKLSNLIWDWGIGAYFLSDIPFDYTTRYAYADKVRQLASVQFQKQDTIAVSEWGAGMGMFAKHFLDSLKENEPNHYENATFTLSEYSEEQAEDVKNNGVLEDHKSQVRIDIQDVHSPKLEKNAIDLMVMNYLVGALPVYGIEVEDGTAYEIIVNTAINDTLTILDTTVFPPQLLDAEKIRELISGNDTTRQRYLLPRLMSELEDTFDRIPLKDSKMSASQKELILEFINSAPSKESHYFFNAHMDFYDALPKIVNGLTKNGLIALHDFGFPLDQFSSRPDQLFATFELSTFFGVNFTFFEWVLKRNGFSHLFLPREYQNMTVLISAESTFPVTLSQKARQIIPLDKINEGRMKDALSKISNSSFKDLEDVEKTFASLPASLQSTFSLTLGLGTICVELDELDAATHYLDLACASYGAIAVPAYVAYGELYFKKGDSKRAEAYFKKALSICPLFPFALFNLIKIYLQNRRIDDYMTDVFDAIKVLSPDFFWMTLPTILMVYRQTNTEEFNTLLNWYTAFKKIYRSHIPLSTMGIIKEQFNE